MADLATFFVAIWGMLEVIKNFIISQIGIVAFICFFIGIVAAKVITSLKGFIILIAVGAVILILVGGVFLLATGMTPDEIAGKASAVPSAFGNAIGDLFDGEGNITPQTNTSDNLWNETGGTG